jgi:hypothetical protein
MKKNDPNQSPFLNVFELAFLVTNLAYQESDRSAV